MVAQPDAPGEVRPDGTIAPEPEPAPTAPEPEPDGTDSDVEEGGAEPAQRGAPESSP